MPTQSRGHGTNPLRCQKPILLKYAVLIKSHHAINAGYRRFAVTGPVYMAAMQHDDTTLTIADIITAYEQGIEVLAHAAFAGMTREQILAWPITGKWSTQELVSHLADTEIYFTDRIERTLMLDRPLLMDVDERPLYTTARVSELRSWRTTRLVRGASSARRPHTQNAAARSVEPNRDPHGHRASHLAAIGASIGAACQAPFAIYRREARCVSQERVRLTSAIHHAERDDHRKIPRNHTNELQSH